MRPDEHLAAVLTAEAAGRQTGFLFFWGHQPQHDGTTGPGCLSQWWPAPYPRLGAFLSATDPKVLVEASPLDRIWGIGMTAGHPDALLPSRWRGSNLLGFALMNARGRL